MSKTYYFKAHNGRVFTSMNPEYHKADERLTVAEGMRLYKQQTREDLTEFIKPGQTVFCNVDSVSASGMSRRISLYVIDGAQLVNITGRAGVLTGWKVSDKGGLIVSGCGMDMCFHTVYTLGRCLWPNGTPEPHGSRNGAPDNDGGYALKSSIL